MKKSQKILSILALVWIAALIFPTTVQAAPPDDGRTIFGESYTLNNGEILNGDLNVLGGVVEIMEGATVTGNVLVVGGVVTVDGTIQGNLTAVGGTVSLTGHALVQGDLISPGSFVTMDEGANVQGDIVQDWTIPDTNIEIPNVTPPQVVQAPSQSASTLTRIGREIGQLLAMAAMGALLLLILPKSVDVMTQSLRAKPWTMLGFGALTALVMAIGGVILTLTICLIPMVILFGLVFAIAALVGWLTLGYVIGKFMASSIFKTSWHPVLAAVIGNLALYLLARGIWTIPCLGWTLVILAALLGLGMVVITLFGTNPYPRSESPAKPEQEVLIFNESEDEPDQSQEMD